MIDEDYLVAGIRQQITALQRLLMDLGARPTEIGKTAPRIRSIETKLKALRERVTLPHRFSPPLS